jgi:hypothetical protein
MRIYIDSCFCNAYYINIQLFPALIRGKVYSVTNTIARGFTMAAPMVIEYTQSPALLLACCAAVMQLLPFMITDLKQIEEKQDDNKKPLLKTSVN